MNPYLERPDVWQGVHNAVIFCLNSAINAVLPSDYFAKMDERLYIEEIDRDFIPDISITRSASQPPSRSGGAMVLEVPESPRLLVVDEPTIREAFIEIVNAKNPAQVVTVIEILSLANKQNGRGREEYVRKQRDILESTTHLLEIDLLRAGQHTIAAPEWHMRREFGPWTYSVCLHRAETGGRYEIFALNLHDRLPSLIVPLSEGVPDVRISLQDVLNRAYDEGRLAYSARYHDPPDPPLDVKEQAWADEILRSLRN